MNNETLRVVAQNKGLQARGLGKYFGQKRVVRNVSLGIRRGEAVGLLGPNGAGKTTTFYMLTGLIPCDEGAMYLDGMDVTDTPLFQRARMGVGYLPQESSIFRGLSVEKNILSVLEITERNSDTRDAMLEELLAEFSIGHLRNTPSVNLSGGERRRLEIARALAARPSFLLLDEPLAGVNPKLSEQLLEIIFNLNKNGINILMVEHNIDAVMKISERVVVMAEGKIISDGKPDFVRSDTNVIEAYLGSSNE